jgi:hypothetical protein
MHSILIAGAALVGLPILLHLIMKQEPKRLTFPAFRFLTQKLKTNQRKLRLRHFILLALRMLLIAFFCLALYQPTLLSERLNLSGETPIAAVIVIDTSPSMGYTANERTRFEEAKRRALELLETLPEKSPVVVVETDDIAGGRWMDRSEARKAIEQLDKPRGGSQPATSAVAEAYRLLGKIETDVEEAERLPKLVAVFTDRAASSWDAANAERIKKFLETLPDPKPAHIVFDVGADHPTNVAILAAEMKPQVLAANEKAIVTVTVAATGPANEPAVETTVKATINGTAAEPKRIQIPYGQTRAVTFEFSGLKPGLQQVMFELAAHDRLQFDDYRYLTFKVGSARLVLTIAETEEAAEYWQRGHIGRDGFGCLVVTPNDVIRKDGATLIRYPNPEHLDGEPITDDIRAFDVVCLLGIRDPSVKPDGLDSLWDKIVPYVERGGKLIIVPGDDRLSLAGYSDAAHAALKTLLPGTLKSIIDTRTANPSPPMQTAPGWNDPREGQNGVTWYLGDDKVLQHPMLRPFLEWRKLANVDVWQNPRVTRKYWDVEKADGAAVIVRYNDSAKPGEGRPAILERGVPDPNDKNKIKGKVILLTTRLDAQPGSDPWHDYWETEGSTWFAVFPWLLERYLAGDSADANFNHLTGQPSGVTVPLPKGGVPRGLKVAITGPGISQDNDLIEVGERQLELQVGPPRTNLPGNFRLSVDAVKWTDGFSLNVPAEESTLEKVPVEAIEELTGKDSVVPLDKNRDLRDAIAGGGKHPIDLFPWLLIAVLLLLAAEGLVANRFYRRVR